MKDNADGRVNKYDRYELELFARGQPDASTHTQTGTRAAYGRMRNLIKRVFMRNLWINLSKRAHAAAFRAPGKTART